MKRFLTALLVTVLVISMATVAFAAGAGTVYGATVYTTADSDTQVTVPVTVSGEFANFHFTVSSQFQLLEITNATGNVATGLLAYAEAENIEGGSYTVYATFLVPAGTPVGTYPVYVTDARVRDRDGVDLTLSVGDGAIVIECSHEWDDGVVTTPATCTEDGVLTHTCTKCGDVYTEVIPATGHDYVGVVTTPATCTEDGVMTYTCSICGHSYTEVIPSEEGHAWDKGVVTKAATCTEDGIMTYTCTKCGHTKTEVIPAAGHKWETVWSSDETYHWHECSVCGEKKDHDEHDFVIVDRLSATSKKDGWEKHKCSICDYEKTVVIPANPDIDDVPGTGDITDTVNMGMALALVTMFGMVALVVKRRTAK